MFIFEIGMKSKRILKFYFNAEGLNRALDRIILNYACSSSDCNRGCEYYAERISALIGVKSKLSEFYAYLDRVLGEMKEEEREVLCYYANLRVGIKKLPDERRRGIKRAVMKFTRHARFIDRFAEGVKLVYEYYCLM